MKTRLQKFGESRLFIPVTALLYLALAALLISVMGMRTKGEIEILLTQWVPRFLQVNFLLIVIGFALCRRDIAAAIRGLFAASPHPYPLPNGEREERMNLPQGEREKGNLPQGEREEGSNSPHGEMKVARGNRIQVSPPLAGGDEGEGEKRSLWNSLRRPGVYLLVILVAGILLVTLFAPQVHRIYYDEDIYANMAQNIAYTGQAGMANYGTFEYGEYFVNWLLYNKDPSGWPFLISLVFQLFGTDEIYAFYLNNLLFAGGILVVFFIARGIAGGWAAGLLAALIYAIIPHNLIWSNTIAAENPAAFFGGLAVLCTLVWLRSRETRHLFLMMTVLPFACTMRPESAMIGMWALAAAAMNLFSADSPHPGPLPQGERENGMNLPQEEMKVARATRIQGSPPLAGGDDGEGEEGALRSGGEPGMNFPFAHPFATRVFWAMGLVSFALIIPLIWHFFAMSGQSWGAQGAKFSTLFFPHNLETNGFYYLENKAFPVLVTLLALIGIAAGKGRSAWGTEETGRLPVFMIALWFLLFWGIFLFFYAGSYKYGADVRFALVSFMPLAVLAGIGADILRTGGEKMAQGSRKNPIAGEGPAAGGRSACLGAACGKLSVVALLVLVLVVSWLKFLPLIRLVGQEAWGARYDHAYAREFIKKIPNRAIVLTHIPTMFLLWGQNAIQTYAGINNPDIIRDLMKRYGGHVYFHQSYWCNTLNDANRAVCEGIRQRYDLDPVAVAREQAHEYGLYRMTFK